MRGIGNPAGGQRDRGEAQRALCREAVPGVEGDKGDARAARRRTGAGSDVGFFISSSFSSSFLSFKPFRLRPATATLSRKRGQQGEGEGEGLLLLQGQEGQRRRRRQEVLSAAVEVEVEVEREVAREGARAKEEEQEPQQGARRPRLLPPRRQGQQGRPRAQQEEVEELRARGGVGQWRRRAAAVKGKKRLQKNEN